MSEEKIKVVVANQCGFCSELKAEFKDAINRGEIDIVSVDEQEGLDLVFSWREKGIIFEEVPQCLIEYKDGKLEVFDCENLPKKLHEVVD